jgi:hypothetical protein
VKAAAASALALEQCEPDSANHNSGFETSVSLPRWVQIRILAARLPMRAQGSGAGGHCDLTLVL